MRQLQVETNCMFLSSWLQLNWRRRLIRRWAPYKAGREKNKMTHIDQSPSNFPEITPSFCYWQDRWWADQTVILALLRLLSLNTRGSCNGILHKNIEVYVHEVSKSCNADLGSLVRSYYCTFAVTWETICTTPKYLMKIVSFTSRINNSSFLPENNI